MDALCREIGGRGRCDTGDVADAVPDIQSDNSYEAVKGLTDAENVCEYDNGLSELVQELHSMKLMALSMRVLSMGVERELAEQAMEAADPKSALIKLVVDIESKRGRRHRSGQRDC